MCILHQVYLHFLKTLRYRFTSSLASDTLTCRTPALEFQPQEVEVSLIIDGRTQFETNYQYKPEAVIKISRKEVHTVLR